MVATLALALGCTPGDAGDSPKDGEGADTATVHDTGGEDSGPDSAADSSPDSAPDTAPPGADEDGDGWSVDDGDCDDTRDNVYPGAPDGCDALDQDCDGTAIPDGACGAGWDPVASASWVVTGASPDAGLDARGAAGPTDATGRPAALLDRSVDRASAVALLPGGASLEPRMSDVSLPVWHAIYGRDTIGILLDAGDANGDGFHDLTTGYVGNDTGYTGNLYLVLGRAGGWPAGVSDIRGVAEGWWTDDADTPTYLDHFPGADLDADGTADLVIVTNEGDGLAAWRPYFGGTAAPPYEADVASTDVALTHYNGALSVFYSATATLPDLDGDGSGELMVNDNTTVGGRGTLLFVEGEALLGGVADVTDVGTYAYFDDGAAEGGGIGWLAESPGLAADLDGDGYPELAINRSIKDDDGDGGMNCASFVAGGAIPSGDLGPGELARLCPPHDTAAASSPSSYPERWIPDIDGDGLSDVFINWSDDQDSRDNRRCILRASEVAAGGVYGDYEPQSPCFWEEDGQDQVFTDLTGDGLPEWIFSDDGYDDPTYGEDAGRILILEGFDVPFDDPSRW